MTKTRWIAATLVIAVPLIAMAESLKEKQQRKREDELLQASLKTMNDDCKTSIKAVGDWDTFKGALQDDQAHHVGAYCGVALDAMAELCHSGDEAKASIRKGVTTFRCAAGDTDVKLSGRVVTFTTRLVETRNDVRHYVRDYLAAHL